jgi:hypothetical protein
MVCEVRGVASHVRDSSLRAFKEIGQVAGDVGVRVCGQAIGHGSMTTCHGFVVLLLPPRLASSMSRKPPTFETIPNV